MKASSFASGVLSGAIDSLRMSSVSSSTVPDTGRIKRSDTMLQPCDIELPYHASHVGMMRGSVREIKPIISKSLSSSLGLSIWEAKNFLWDGVCMLHFRAYDYG